MLKFSILVRYHVLLASVASLTLIAVGCSGAPDEPSQAEQAKGESPTEDTASDLIPAELMLELPDNCNTPDALCLLPDGDIILSVPNVKKLPGIPYGLNQPRTTSGKRDYRLSLAAFARRSEPVTTCSRPLPILSMRRSQPGIRSTDRS